MNEKYRQARDKYKKVWEKHKTNTMWHYPIARLQGYETATYETTQPQNTNWRNRKVWTGESNNKHYGMQ